MRPVGPSNKGAAAQGPSAGQHLSGKGSGQLPASPSAATAASTASDQSLGRAGSSNDGADGQYGLAYGMAQSHAQQGYTTPVVSKVCSKSPIKSTRDIVALFNGKHVSKRPCSEVACAGWPSCGLQEAYKVQLAVISPL